MVKLLFTLTFLLVASLTTGKTLEHYAINEFQVIGSHNSYKKFMDEQLFLLLEKQNPDLAKTLFYGHESLSQQLNLGLRSLEIDVLYDPNGGLYSDPSGYKLIGKLHSEKNKNILQQPGYKVLHIPDLDFESTCLSFKLCLLELKEWSNQNQGHFPVFITMNIKQTKTDIINAVQPLKFSSHAANQLDQELLSFLGRNKLLTPDDVRGSFKTLNQAIKQAGWPKYKDAKNKFVFILDANKSTREIYLKNHPSLKARTMFASFKPGHDASAIVLANNPVKSEEKIKTLVSEGYIVRTRADAATVEARQNLNTRKNVAFASGAQIVTTDYYPGANPFNTPYQVVFPNNTYLRVTPKTPNTN